MYYVFLPNPKCYFCRVKNENIVKLNVTYYDNNKYKHLGWK